MDGVFGIIYPIMFWVMISRQSLNDLCAQYRLSFNNWRALRLQRSAILRSLLRLSVRLPVTHALYKQRTLVRIYLHHPSHGTDSVAKETAQKYSLCRRAHEKIPIFDQYLAYRKRSSIRRNLYNYAIHRMAPLKWSWWVTLISRLRYSSNVTSVSETIRKPPLAELGKQKYVLQNAGVYHTTKILWKTAYPRRISQKSGNRLLSYGQNDFQYGGRPPS